MNFFEIFQIFSNNVWVYGGSFILILSLLVFVHEWGHYIVARWCGVRVEQFSIGFGKEIAGWTDKNNTRWKLSMIPLGGYVKLYGDTDPASSGHDETVKDSKTGKTRKMTKKDREVAFFAKSVWKRAAIVIAGPAINYIFAIILLGALFSINGQPVTPPSAAAVIVGSSADKYNFKPHDLILSIDDKKMSSFEDVRREMMIALDTEKHFVIQRGDDVVDIYAKPEKVESEDRFGFKQSRGLLGLISPRHAINLKNVIRIGKKSYEPAEGEEVDIAAIRADVKKRMDKVFEIEIKMGDSNDVLTVHPLSDFNHSFEDEESADFNLLFISDIEGNVYAQYSPPVAFVKAIQETWVVTRGTVEALGQMVMGTRSATELGGVIRIGALAGDMAKQGLVALVLFTALLSINLGLINLFPIPLLDGGHLVFYVFEAVLGKPIPDQIQEYAFRFGLVFLVGIMVFANLNDILQLFL